MKVTKLKLIVIFACLFFVVVFIQSVYSKAYFMNLEELVTASDVIAVIEITESKK